MNDKPDYYAPFINGLLGLIDEAELLGLDEDGIVQLREALECFESDYRIRKHDEREAAEREAAVRSSSKS